jgi:hypothetical protein
VLERLNYYDGQFMVARDFSDEQAFLLGKHREHVHYLHGWGTVCGLKVTQHPDPACRDRFILIEPGLGLDCCGREIHVTEKIYVDLRAELSAAPDKPAPGARTLLISLCYDECRTEYAPVLYSDCACGQDRCEPSRVRETFSVKLAMGVSAPKPKPRDPGSVKLDRVNTLNFDNAFRIALDPKLGRIYLLNGKTPAQAAVYDANTSCLLGAVDLGGPALDIAVSPDGATLYAVAHVTGPDAYKLRAFNVTDLSAVKPAGTDLDAGSGVIDPAKPPQIAVSSTHVFVLNAVANKVFIFNTTPTLALFQTFDKGKEEFRSIAVTSDGSWLFVAAPGHAWAVDVASLAGTPSVTPIAIADDRVRLAVSGDGSRLFAGTSKKTVHLFTVQQQPVPFPEVGTGVSVTDDIVSMSASQNGATVYVLGNAAGKAVVRVVNAGKLEKDPGNAVGDPVPAGNSPQEIVLDAGGKWLYVVVNGAAGATCSGAAVFSVTERDCEEIVWATLDGCPDCDDGSCILLAAISDYELSQSIDNARIDNRVRPMLPSTNTLHELIECCCGNEATQAAKGDKGDKGDPGLAATIAVGTVSSGPAGSPPVVVLDPTSTPQNAVFDFTIPKGEKGSKGDPGSAATIKVGTVSSGPAGSPPVVMLDPTSTPQNAVFDFTIPKGEKGDPGVCDCCEDGLTRIQALSWTHDRGSGFAMVSDPTVPTPSTVPAIVVLFGPNKVRLPDAIAGRRIFRVEMIDQQTERFRCYCEVQGSVFGVEQIKTAADGTITTAIKSPAAARSASGLAFQFGAPWAKLIQQRLTEVRVTILGDFILDEKGHAVDAEFPRAELPTGDHPSGAKEGIQGGTFHSWFWVQQRPDGNGPN